MDNNSVRDQIISVLASNYIFIDSNEPEDIDLSLYIEDSIQFVSFLIGLEERFLIEFPDELLSFDKMRYLSNVCTVIEELTKKQ